MPPELLAITFFVVTFGLIFRGYPVAFTLAGCGLIFFFIGVTFGYYPLAQIKPIPSRIYGIMSNGTLLAIPYFVFMGGILQKSALASDMLEALGKAFGKLRGGLGITVIVVGALLAASTSIVAASVITMGLIALPKMLKKGYSKEYATGVIVASGTLGQIIPPSIVLIVLADQMGISVGDVFKGAILPGVLLTILYIIYTLILGVLKPSHLPIIADEEGEKGVSLFKEVLLSSLPPLLLIVVVLGSIFGGIATPTEAGALGAMGAILLAAMKRRITWGAILEAAKETVSTTSMVMFLLVGSTMFALVFRGYNGDGILESFLLNLPAGKIGFILFVSLFIFLLGFFIDFFEITFIVVPLLIPAAAALEIDLVWLAIIVSMNMQTSFLTPPFGISLFFLKSAAPPEIEMQDIIKGVIPFVFLQVICLILVIVFPQLVTYLL